MKYLVAYFNIPMGWASEPREIHGLPNAKLVHVIKTEAISNGECRVEAIVEIAS